MRVGRGLILVGLGLAWAGYWAPWIAHRAAALNLNGYELAEWITFLPGVRDGTLRLGRLDFLAPLSAISILTCLAAAAQPNLSPLVRWPARALALIGAIAILPEYPFILTAPSDPELRPALILGLVTITVVCASMFGWERLFPRPRSRGARDGAGAIGARAPIYAMMLLAALAPGFALRALVTVRPALAVLFDAPPRLNWGPVALAVGSLLIGVGGLLQSRAKGPTT